MQAEHGVRTPDYQNAPGKEGRAMGREHSLLGSMEMGQPLLWHQGGHPRSRSQLWLSGMLPTLTSSVSQGRVPATNWTLCDPNSISNLGAISIPAAPCPTPSERAFSLSRNLWWDCSECCYYSTELPCPMGWLMFIKPATEAFMAGHPVSGGITQSSALLTQDCACSCAHVQNWIFMRFWVWAQSFAIPPDFRSSFSCNSAQEQNIPLWLA